MAQQTEEQLRSRKELQSVIDTLPTDEIVHAFAYGSGVFAQDVDKATTRRRSADDLKLVDLIVVVNDATRFHTANLTMNPNHYSIRNASFCATLQTHQLPRNPWLRNPGLFFIVTDTFKYGVVERRHICDDLKHWSYLYLAGRLHKPTVTIMRDDELQVEYQEQCNLPAALAAGLLLTDSATVPVSHLFQTIASLSYNGDPRLQVGGEDPDKISKLVQPIQQQWLALYKPAAQQLQQDGILSMNNDASWSWDAKSASARAQLRRQLPDTTTSSGDPLSRVLPRIVAPAARYQLVKGVLSAGPSRSMAYAYRKLSKGILRRLV